MSVAIHSHKFNVSDTKALNHSSYASFVVARNTLGFIGLQDGNLCMSRHVTQLEALMMAGYKMRHLLITTSLTNRILIIGK